MNENYQFYNITKILRPFKSLEREEKRLIGLLKILKILQLSYLS